MSRPVNRENSSEKSIEKSGGKAKKEKSLCPSFGLCGACTLLNMPYPQQLARKKKRIEKLLAPYCSVENILGMEDPLHYRNKVHAVLGRTKAGHVTAGTYQEGTHRIVPVKDCLIEDAAAGPVIQEICRLAESFRLPVFDEDTGRGFLRHVLIRTARETGQMMVVLVAASPVFPSRKNFVRELQKLHPEITTVVLNVNPKKTSMVLGEKEIVLSGSGSIEDKLCGCTFRISPRSFYQVNAAQAQVLFEKAMEYAAMTGKEKVIDAYCGIGTIGLIAASRGAGEVTGIELNRAAVRDAAANAKRNGIRNAVFLPGDAGQYMRRLAAEGKKADILFMDPPRSGSDETFLRSAAALSPRKIVYISCGPESLARDLGVLTKLGYRAERACAVDLFPETEHVESCVLLERVSN